MLHALKRIAPRHGIMSLFSTGRRWLCLAVCLLAACQPEYRAPQAAAPAVCARPEAQMQPIGLQECRSRLKRIDAVFQADPQFYEIPRGVRVDLDRIRLSTIPYSDNRTAGSTLAEVETFIQRFPGGRETVSHRLKQLTLSVALKKLTQSQSAPWELDDTLAHELGHACFATRYPLVYVKSGDFNLIEGHAVTVQWRWLQRHVRGVTEAAFLRSRPAAYRNAYLHFQRRYMRGGHVDWSLIERREAALRSQR
ncbi:MAG: hypothetical protein LUE08_04020, partial [Akkermansiaceae bacterium]|nr:hypothetical protein [Akkermansiaceae bacterium]